MATYRYLEIQLLEFLGGWCHTIPQLAFKATFGYHVYDHAQAADELGTRLEQLRSSPERAEAATDDFARLCQHVWELEPVVDRLVAVYRVLEPHLVSTYVYHADATDPLSDAPTVKLLRRLASMAQSHVAWGQAVLESLTQTPELRKQALDVQADLEARLLECGGVTGQGIESHWLTFHSAKEEAKPPQRPSRGLAQGYRFVKRCPPQNHPTVEAPFWFSDQRPVFRQVYTAPDEWSLEGFRHKFHQLLYGEVETTDRMGKMLAEHPELPWAMRVDLAHQMWDEARHIEIVAKVCEDELGAALGYGPWPLIWWWMQNESDPLRRIAVTNGWAEANLMHTLRRWRDMAVERGYDRIAELCDYLQADELTHVKLVTYWMRELTADQPDRFNAIVAWSRDAVVRIQQFYNDNPASIPDKGEIRFSFLRGEAEPE
ncbi:MAG: DUF455 family protein [Chloroflexi bacterium]|nr:DUF455 family protein [Chloroflexota bacterium]